MKQKAENILLVVITLILLIGYLTITSNLNRNNRLYTLKQKLLHEYYSEEILQKKVEETLGDAYTGDFQKDFDEYVIRLFKEEAGID